MKKLKLLFLVTLSISYLIPGFSQTENQTNSKSIDFNKLGKAVPGKLHYKNGKIEEMIITYDNPEDLKKLTGDIKYTKKEWAAFGTASKDNLEAFEIDGHIWKRITFEGDEQFGIVHIDGAIKYFSLFKIPFARVTGDYKEESYFQKLDQEPISETAFTMKYKKTILSLVSDNEVLKGKFERKEKGYKNFFTFEKVIKEYNAWYAEQHPDESKLKAADTTTTGASDLGIPKGLFGVWTFEKNIFTITPAKVTAQIDVGADKPNIVEWNLTSYDKEKGFISGKIISVNSMGYDATETYAEGFSGFLSFTELTEETVIISYQGITIAADSGLNDLKKDPEDVKFLGKKYSKD